MELQTKDSAKGNNSKANKTITTDKEPSTVEEIEDIRRLVQLLQIHQIELEHQNEELRIAQVELETSRTEYVNLFDFAPIPYFKLNKQGLIKEVNIKASEMCGVERRKLVSSNFKTLILQEERNKFNQFIQTVFDTKIKQRCEIRIKNKTNCVYEVLLEGLEIIDLVEKDAYCHIALIDLTDYKSVENDLKKTAEQLILLNATKDKFFSIIAHDLRSPFHALLGLSEILASDGESYSPDEIKSFGKGLNDNVKNIYHLLDNLLKWAMMQRDMVIFKPERMNLFEVVNSVVEMTRESLKNKKITIYNDVNKDIDIYADSSMLFSIIHNLITNAIKFTAEFGKIIVEAGERHDLVEVSVQDTGIGINIDTLSNLFDFASVITTNGTNGEKGTGLGLPLCKEFVEKNGGKLWANSEVGKGTKIMFTLPKK